MLRILLSLYFSAIKVKISLVIWYTVSFSNSVLLMQENTEKRKGIEQEKLIKTITI